jgi:3-oxoacyl-[acyl-carrier-protein] synthase I
MKELAITAASCITAVGHDGRMTAAAVRAGITRMGEFTEFPDKDGNPITVARIRGFKDAERDTGSRLGGIASICLVELLAEYFQVDRSHPSRIHLFLGVSSEERPGQRYAERYIHLLLKVMEEWSDKTDLQIIPQGNASTMYAIEQAGQLIESNPAAMCIIGGIDSLLRASTLSWFEKDNRLKSISYGRHQGLIAGEAVGFLTVEDPARAKQANRPVLARISGLGIVEKPASRAENSTSRGTGLTNACRTALNGGKGKEIRALFGDLNGENSRALEWSMAETRCFKSSDGRRQLWTPANCYGDIGAASGAVMANIVTQGFVRGWLQSPTLIFCSDDHGSCGAMVVEKGEYSEVKTSGPI